MLVSIIIISDNYIDYVGVFSYAEQGKGAGIHATGGTKLIIDSSTLELNEVKSFAGVVDTTQMGGGALYIEGSSTAVVTSSRFATNHASVHRGDLLFLAGDSTASLDECVIEQDATKQRHYYASGLFVLRNTSSSSGVGLAFDRFLMDPTSVPPAFADGLCPPFTTQSVDWNIRNVEVLEVSGSTCVINECDDDTHRAATGGFSCPDVPKAWGASCSECMASTRRIDLPQSQALAFPHLHWACECPAGYAGESCSACRAGTYMPGNSTTVVAHCSICAAGMYSTGEANVACSQCPAGLFGSTQGAVANQEPYNSF
jgi:hypothetical protein